MYFSDTEAFGGLLLFPPCDDDVTMLRCENFIYVVHWTRRSRAPIWPKY